MSGPSRILSAFYRPLHLGQLAVATTLSRAFLVSWIGCSLALGVPFGLMISVINEPYPSLHWYLSNQVLGPLVGGVGILSIITVVVLGAYVAASTAATKPVDRAHVRLSLLTPVPFAMPMALWGIASTCADMNGSFGFPRPAPAWLTSWPVDLMGSCFWPIVMPFGAITVFRRGSRQIYRIYEHHCHACAYDLSASPGLCPECGTSAIQRDEPA